MGKTISVASFDDMGKAAQKLQWELHGKVLIILLLLSR